MTLIEDMRSEEIEALEEGKRMMTNRIICLLVLLFVCIIIWAIVSWYKNWKVPIMVPFLWIMLSWISILWIYVYTLVLRCQSNAHGEWGFK